MYTGNFFQLDRHSEIASGLVIFRYLPIIRTTLEGDSTDYPVYISLSRRAVRVYIQFRRGKRKPYQHRELFSLPILPNTYDKKELTKRLINLYDKGLGLGDDYAHIDFCDDSNDVKIPYYWNLAAFTPRESSSYKAIANNYFKGKTDFKEEEKKAKHFLFFRKLLLDFMFDLEYTEVFKHSPYYERVQVNLQDNSGYQAILSKAEYYYWEAFYSSKQLKELECIEVKIEETNRKLKEIEVEIGNNGEVVDLKERKLALEYLKQPLILENKIRKLQEAKENWLEVIREPVSEDIIRAKNNWFVDIESEHISVFEAKYSSSKELVAKFIKSPVMLLPVCWLIEPILCCFICLLYCIYFVVEIVPKITRSGVKELVFNWNEELIKDKSATFGRSVDWFINRYALWKAVYIQYNYVSGSASKVLGMLFFILGISLNYRLFFDGLSQLCLVSKVILISNGLFFSFIISVIVAHLFSSSLFRIISVFNLKIFIASIVIWYLIGKYPALWDVSLEININYVFFAFIITVFLILFKYREILNLSSRPKLLLLRRAVFVSIVAIFYCASIGLWIMTWHTERILTYHTDLETHLVEDTKNNRYILCEECLEKERKQDFSELKEKEQKDFFENKELFDCLHKLKPSVGSIHPIMETVVVKEFPIIGMYTLYIFPGILFFITFLILVIRIFSQIAFQNRPLI